MISPRYLLPLLIVLTGCAQLPGSHPGAILAQRPTRAAVEAFALSGRIAIQHQETRYAVNIAWQHAAQSDEIMLSTPLGQGVAELIRHPGGMRLITADRREYAAPDWPALSSQVFGIELPLAGLPRWLVGAVPAAALGLQRDGRGRPQHMLVDGWQVSYLAYESDAAEALPTALELRREDIEVKLKIDEWQIQQ